jgi:hypothetical protein
VYDHQGVRVRGFKDEWFDVDAWIRGKVKSVDIIITVESMILSSAWLYLFEGSSNYINK